MDGRTDRQTDRQNYDPQDRASIATSSGKNNKNSDYDGAAATAAVATTTNDNNNKLYRTSRDTHNTKLFIITADACLTVDNS